MRQIVGEVGNLHWQPLEVRRKVLLIGAADRLVPAAVAVLPCGQTILLKTPPPEVVKQGRTRPVHAQIILSDTAVSAFRLFAPNRHAMLLRMTQACSLPGPANTHGVYRYASRHMRRPWLCGLIRAPTPAPDHHSLYRLRHPGPVVNLSRRHLPNPALSPPPNPHTSPAPRSASPASAPSTPPAQ